MKNSLIEAIEDAMWDFVETDGFTPSNPAILYDEKRKQYYYGSTLIGDTVIMKLETGFGSWEPVTVADIPAAAKGLANEITDSSAKETP